MISEPGGRRAATSAVSAASTATATGKGFKGYSNKVEGSRTAKFAHNTDIRCNWVNQHETILFISVFVGHLQSCAKILVFRWMWLWTWVAIVIHLGKIKTPLAKVISLILDTGFLGWDISGSPCTHICWTFQNSWRLILYSTWMISNSVEVKSDSATNLSNGWVPQAPPLLQLTSCHLK